MKQQYAQIRDLKGNPQKQAGVTRQFLQRMRDWIVNADPGEDFRDLLRKAMAEVFGPG